MNQARRKADWEKCILRPSLLDSKPETLSPKLSIAAHRFHSLHPISLSLPMLCSLTGMPSLLFSSLHLAPALHFLSSRPLQTPTISAGAALPRLSPLPCLYLSVLFRGGNPGPQPCYPPRSRSPGNALKGRGTRAQGWMGLDTMSQDKTERHQVWISTLTPREPLLQFPH